MKWPKKTFTLFIIIFQYISAIEQNELNQNIENGTKIKSREKRFVWFPYNSCFAVSTNKLTKKIKVINYLNILF